MKHRFDAPLLVGCVALAWAALLIANALFLPPDEGFDESAHYSYISLLADTGEIPDFRMTPVDARLTRDRHGLPRPYSSVLPFDRNGGATYYAFWRSPESDRSGALERWWQVPSQPASYEPGKTPNWQGQHPPLYYALMTVPYQLTRHWSPGNRLTVLRLTSVAIAWSSLLFWLAILRCTESDSARRTIVGAGAVMLWLPSCWYDLGRLGNDSLACLVMSAVCLFLVRGARQGWHGWGNVCGLAFALACGLWTKGFFVPVWAASVVFVLWECMRHSRLSRIECLSRAAFLSLFPLVAIAPWMHWSLQLYGTPFPAVDFYRFAQQGRSPDADVGVLRFGSEILRKLAGSCRTFLWCGTWSWVSLPLSTYVLMGPLVLTACAGWFSRESWCDRETRQLRTVAIVIVGALVAGFVHFYSRCIYWTGSAIGGEGYYYFVAWLSVGILLSSGAMPARSPALRWLMPVALAAAWMFEISGHWFLFQVYAGEVQKLEPQGYGGGVGWPTWDNVQLVLSRLEQLTWCSWGLLAYSVSVVSRGLLVVLLVRSTRCIP